jgi:hypothetical protein
VSVAALERAINRRQRGWFVMVRRGHQVLQLNVPG